MEYSFAARRGRAFSVLAGTIAAIASVFPVSAQKSAPGLHATGEIVATGTMETRRSGHTATPLHNGQVLIIGGMVKNGEFVAEAELYDSSTGKFSPAGRMASPRVGHTATLLPDGRVLIVGGSARPYQDVAQAEIYDPTTRRFEATGSLITARSDAEAVLLRSGKVLLAGGSSGSDWNRLARAELYDPATGRFQATGSMSLPRISFTMCALRDGRVLVTGGSVAGRYPNAQLTGSAEIYDPATGKFTPAGSMRIPRHKHAAVLLDNGRVLIVGGSDNRDWPGKMDSAEIYDPATGKFGDAGRMSEARFKLTNAIVRLPEGKVLIAGGAGHAEIFDPASLRFNLVAGPEMDGRYFSTATLLSGGRVLLTGGYGENVEPSSNGAWVYIPSRKPVESSTSLK
jgi:Galactose oxidase, central domain/Kelch motif